MAPIHLNEYKRDKLAYFENGRRFCLLRETGTRVSAYNIDISGPGEQYFKSLYRPTNQEGYRSADGIYIGSFHYKGRQINFVCVLELEGKTNVSDPVGQVICTLDHFCKGNREVNLEDDGNRLHMQAITRPRPYLFTKKHLVVGIIIGSEARKGIITIHNGVPIICLNSRQPNQDKTPKALFEEISKYTGEPMFHK